MFFASPDDAPKAAPALPQAAERQDAPLAPPPASPSAECGEFPAGLEIPRCAESADTHEVHAYFAFTLCYREQYELAEWVAYELTVEELEAKVTRTNNFRADPAISTGSASPADYYRSGYDRGHLAPAADMRFDERAMSESFLMSNIAPQTPSLNRRTWMYAEEETRRLAAAHGRVWVVSGPVLDPNGAKTIGKNRVAVPDYFFKALLFPVEDEPGFGALAFIMPNASPASDFMAYRVSIDEIEARTGLDLFPSLSDEIETLLEAEGGAPWPPAPPLTSSEDARQAAYTRPRS